MLDRGNLSLGELRAWKHSQISRDGGAIEPVTAWREGGIRTDVFGRDAAFGGQLSFCFVDGDHSEEQVRRDFANVDEHLVPGGFVLFDDSDEFGAFPQVTTVVREAIREHGYTLVGQNPHHLLRKPAVARRR